MLCFRTSFRESARSMAATSLAVGSSRAHRTAEHRVSAMRARSATSVVLSPAASRAARQRRARANAISRSGERAFTLGFRS